MPCLAKKYEASREEFSHNGVPDVDIVISTRELADMIREAGIQFSQLEDQEYDSPLGESTGRRRDFGATGGVLEAALRTAADWLAGQDLQEIDFTAVRGIRGIKEATVNIAGIELHVAICSGLGNARKLLNKIQRGEADYQAIEIMACPRRLSERRRAAPTTTDTGRFFPSGLKRSIGTTRTRRSANRTRIRRSGSCMPEFLGEPGSHFAHKLLHTHYIARSKK